MMSLPTVPRILLMALAAWALVVFAVWGSCTCLASRYLGRVRGTIRSSVSIVMSHLSPGGPPDEY